MSKAFRCLFIVILFIHIYVRGIRPLDIINFISTEYFQYVRTKQSRIEVVKVEKYRLYQHRIRQNNEACPNRAPYRH